MPAEKIKEAVEELDKGKETAILEKMTGVYQITIRLGDKDWTCTPPSLGDHVRFFAKIRAKKVLTESEEYLKTLIRAGISEELAVKKYDEQVRGSQPSEIEIFNATNSLEGAKYYFLAAAKRNHKELTEKVVDSLITEDNWEDVMVKINTLSPQADPSKNPKGESPKKT